MAGTKTPEPQTTTETPESRTPDEAALLEQLHFERRLDDRLEELRVDLAIRLRRCLEATQALQPQATPPRADRMTTLMRGYMVVTLLVLPLAALLFVVSKPGEKVGQGISVVTGLLVGVVVQLVFVEIFRVLKSR